MITSDWRTVAAKRVLSIAEAIKLFPGLLKQRVTFGETDNVDLLKAKTVTFQFIGDGNCRTLKLVRGRTRTGKLKVLRSQFSKHFPGTVDD
jgi:hypothetical protein